jgi:hypothetical protein
MTEPLNADCFPGVGISHKTCSWSNLQTTFEIRSDAIAQALDADFMWFRRLLLTGILLELAERFIPLQGQLCFSKGWVIAVGDDDSIIWAH